MGDDEALLDVVTSVNIACGLHAGDPLIMAGTVAAAHRRGVGVGAHPGHNDRWGFGRRALPGVTAADLGVMVAYQVGALIAVAALQGVRVGHVKLHGALNNQAAVDDDLARVLAAAVHGVDASLLWLAPSGSAMARAGEAVGLRVAHEVFADRAYDDAGNLVGRDRLGAVIDDPDEVAARAVGMVVDGVVVSMSGSRVGLRADTVCVHGDTPGAVAVARATRAALERAGVSVEPLVPAG